MVRGGRVRVRQRGPRALVARGEASGSLGDGDHVRAGHSALHPWLWDDHHVSISVLIVDDHLSFRRSARALLEAEGFRVVGAAADGAEALRLSDAFAPDVVLLDIQLPDLDGFAVAERLAGRPDAPIVVLVSSREAAVYGKRLAASPARGFLPKSDLSGEALDRLLA